MADIGSPPRPRAARLPFPDVARSKLLVAIVSLLTTLVLTVAKPGLGLATGSLALMVEPAEGEDIAKVCRARHMIAAKVGGEASPRQ